ncbi:MAG: hypothetical protein WCE44_01670 [Candidatus Velthaea sp.]|jgi:hypothetical protein
MARQTLAGIIPLAAVCIALADYLFDHTQPRWQSPWFWISLVAMFALLGLVQALRFLKSPAKPPSKPDYSATSIVRRPLPPDEGQP